MKSTLKIFAISVYFLIGIFMSLSGNAEYNLATKKEEQILFSTASEIKLGRSLVQKVEKRYKVSKDTQLQERVDTIGQRIATICERKDISYFFTVLEEEKVNAFALPGGYIYVNKGLIEKADSDDEIAGVLAHEIGHIVARHSIKRLQAALGYNLISILAAAATKDARFKRGADIAFNQIMLGYSREDEILADQLAVKYVKRSGYNPKAVISFLEKLKQIEKEAPLKPLVPAYARTHPFIPERLGAAKQEVYGKMDFDDYLNRANQ
jgi:predicted Zn-dependent protease